MEAMEALTTRRSIRQYEQKAVSDELIQKILKAAMAAPSAGNAQPWEFLVITDRYILNEIPAIYPAASMAPDAAAAILCCANPSREVYKGYWIQDCSAAIENLLIAAHAHGIGAVWIGLYPDMDQIAILQKRFGIPASIIPIAMIPLGWPAENPGPEDRYDAARVHKNAW